MLIDGGGRVDYSADADDEAEPFEPDVPRIGEMVVSEFLWEKGYSHIDHLVVTHADADHSQGLLDVVLNFSVGEIFIGAVPATDSEMAELLTLADRFSIPLRQIGRGESFELGGVPIDVLWPIRSTEAIGSDNNSSLVLKFAYGEATFLFTGDIEKEAEAELLNSGSSLKADVVKVPHHGSRTSSTAEFVDAVAPRLAVIPVGNRSLFGHPHTSVVDRWRSVGAVVQTTGSTGTITIVSNGKASAWTTYQP
jgi:competence protein ComEC